MREAIRDKERLTHIKQAIDKLQSKSTKAWRAEAANDDIVFFGLVKMVEIIGEAVYKLTLEFKSAHPATDWRVIEDMRHIMVHGYYKLNAEIVWDTIEFGIPELSRQIDEYLQEME